MLRALLTALGVIVAVVAGVGSGLNWLTDHVNDLAISITGWLTLIALALAWWLSALSVEEWRWVPTMNQRKRRWRWGAYAVGTFTVGWVFLLFFVNYTESGTSQAALGYAFTAIAIIPLAVELFLIDRASHTRCLDCREEIRVGATVCKHCGFRLGPKPQIES